MRNIRTKTVHILKLPCVFAVSVSVGWRPLWFCDVSCLLATWRLRRLILRYNHNVTTCCAARPNTTFFHLLLGLKCSVLGKCRRFVSFVGFSSQSQPGRPIRAALSLTGRALESVLCSHWSFHTRVNPDCTVRTEELLFWNHEWISRFHDVAFFCVSWVSDTNWEII